MLQKVSENLIESSQDAINLEDKFGAHNYKPLPVVLTKGEGIFMYDVEGRRYFDFLSAYSALNQGHSHPRLVDAMVKQAQQLTLTSRAFYNDKLGLAEKFLAKTFGYDKVLMMNSGAEAVETAIKLARRWGYVKKGIPDTEAIVVVASNNFHGRTSTLISFSTDNASKNGFGPYMNGFFVVGYDNPEALAEALSNPKVCGFLLEPMQGEAGVVVPDDGYLAKVRELCTKNNVLWLNDEIQTGIGRTGKMLCADHENVKGDILILGKALSGGMMPVSAVLANDDVMLNINPGEHGSTFGGNPLASVLAIEAVSIIQDEKLAENASAMGEIFRERMQTIDSEKIILVRGKGLLNAIKVDDSDGISAYDICKMMKEKGLLAKQTHGNIIRFAPPLIINQEQMHQACDIIESVFMELKR